MARIRLVLPANDVLSAALADALRQSDASRDWKLAAAADLPPDADVQDAAAYCVYLPSAIDKEGMIPDLAEAEKVFRYFAGCECRSMEERKFVLVSSALIYGTGPERRGLVNENYSVSHSRTDSISTQWNLLEELAGRLLAGKCRLTVLRPVTVIPSHSLIARTLVQKFGRTLPGHDPTLQALGIPDFARAICCALAHSRSGTYNVAPDEAITLHRAIRLARGHRMPIPRTLRRLSINPDKLEYLRYSSTVSNGKIKRELGFSPRESSADAIRRSATTNGVSEHFDEFGMDRQYIDFYGNTLFRFLCDHYWRIEEKGLEHIPRVGRAVIVGTHRGFMPFDGVMTLHLLVRKTGRIPRFMTHPSLLKFPFLGNFMTKLGGMIACQASADHVLQSNELLGIFPEGIAGAFTVYRDAYKLQPFSRDAFVKVALRNSAPIIPYVTVGSAEIFPIFGKIKSRFWTRYAEWPFIPVTTPFPLPSKWHIQFLPPIHVDRYPPEAAQDRSVVRMISLEVRTKMQQAIDEMVGARRSIFFGSIFSQEAES